MAAERGGPSPAIQSVRSPAQSAAAMPHRRHQRSAPIPLSPINACRRPPRHPRPSPWRQGYRPNPSAAAPSPRRPTETLDRGITRVAPIISPGKNTGKKSGPPPPIAPVSYHGAPLSRLKSPNPLVISRRDGGRVVSASISYAGSASLPSAN